MALVWVAAIGQLMRCLLCRSLRLEDTYFDKDVEKAFLDASKAVYKTKTEPSLLLANQVGNMYTPSVYAGLASLLAR